MLLLNIKLRFYWHNSRDFQESNKLLWLDIVSFRYILTILIFIFQGKGLVAFAHAKWMRALLQFHTSYLMSSPQCEEIMSSIYAMIETKTKNYQKILQLRYSFILYSESLNCWGFYHKIDAVKYLLTYLGLHVN